VVDPLAARRQELRDHRLSLERLQQLQHRLAGPDLDHLQLHVGHRLARDDGQAQHVGGEFGRRVRRPAGQPEVLDLPDLHGYRLAVSSKASKISSTWFFGVFIWPTTGIHFPAVATKTIERPERQTWTGLPPDLNR